MSSPHPNHVVTSLQFTDHYESLLVQYVINIPLLHKHTSFRNLEKPIVALWHEVPVSSSGSGIGS
jgi:hypothetical protein